MKESVLIIKSEDGFDKKVNVKLTEDHILIKELSNLSHCSPLSSTAIGSPVFNDSYKSSGVFAHQLSQQDSEADRVVTIKRQPGGGLGISVKGGAEHGIPVLISRVFIGQAADQTHLLHPGDAIIAINGKRVEHMMHDDVVAELRTCGAQVALTVRTYDGASQVLNPSAGSTSTADGH